jgi:hypothetical protein
MIFDLLVDICLALSGYRDYHRAMDPPEAGECLADKLILATTPAGLATPPAGLLSKPPAGFAAPQHKRDIEGSRTWIKDIFVQCTRKSLVPEPGVRRYVRDTPHERHLVTHSLFTVFVLFWAGHRGVGKHKVSPGL